MLRATFANHTGQPSCSLQEYYQTILDNQFKEFLSQLVPLKSLEDAFCGISKDIFLEEDLRPDVKPCFSFYYYVSHFETKRKPGTQFGPNLKHVHKQTLLRHPPHTICCQDEPPHILVRHFWVSGNVFCCCLVSWLLSTVSKYHPVSMSDARMVSLP